MTRFVIDAPAAIELVRRGAALSSHHQLVAPSLLRSQVLEGLYHASRIGDISSAEGHQLLELFATMKIRLLGDRHSRATAWKIAEREGWSTTTHAEYLAVTHLQADALIALDPALAASAAGLVPLAELSQLLDG